MIEHPTSTTQEIYARSANAEGEKETLEHHLRRASELCGEFLKPVGMEEAGKAIGILHDFGKSGERFPKVLNGKEHRVNHAAPGAAVVKDYVTGNDIRPIASVIASHHGNLSFELPPCERIKSGRGKNIDFDDKNKQQPRVYSLFGEDEYKQANGYFDSIHDQGKYKVSLPQFDSTYDGCTRKLLLYRMLFSALTDADFSSSAEHFEPGYLAAHTGAPLDCESAHQNLQQLIQAKKSGSTANTDLNRMRDELARNCEQAAGGEPGLYSLTAPTGLGKTMALIKFAITHAEKHGMRRIILVAPYLSIIDQNVRDYKDIIPDLLESHGNARLSEESRLLAERWAASCVVTTNVGFLEPLFSDERTDVRHLHEIAKSVIVLDEAQSLPTDLIYATCCSKDMRIIRPARPKLFV